MTIPKLASCCLIALFAATASAADNTLTEQEKKDGWRLLFNGKDHTGWKTSKGTPIATPVDKNSLLPYKSGGYLIVHEEQFGDFVLKCDVKMSGEKCNSGIFFRVGDLSNPVYTGLEIQIYDGGTGYHSFGAIYDLVPPSKDVVKIDDWNQMTLTCKGPHITVEVNGETVAKMNCDDFDKKGLRPDGSEHKFGVVKDLPRKGYLGFQDHGSPVWIKNIKLKEL